MSPIVAESALFPGDVVYLRARCTRRAAIAEVCAVGAFGRWVSVRLMSDYYDWDGAATNPEASHPPVQLEGSTMSVQAEAIEDLRW